MAYCGQLHASEAKPKRSLETAKQRAKSLGEGRLWQESIGRAMPPLIHTMRHCLLQAQFFFGEADFFSAKRLFLRAARDVSGERSAPPWAREGESRKTHFWLYPTRRSTKGRSPHIPATRLFLFSSIHQNPTIPPNSTKSSSRYQKEPCARGMIFQDADCGSKEFVLYLCDSNHKMRKK